MGLSFNRVENELSRSIILRMKKILTWGGNLPGEALLLTAAIVWGPLFYSGIVAVGIGLTLQVFGQSKVDPAFASLILSLEAGIDLLGRMIFLGERLSCSEWLGCVVMLAAVILVQLKGQQQKH